MPGDWDTAGRGGDAVQGPACRMRRIPLAHRHRVGPRTWHGHQIRATPDRRLDLPATLRGAQIFATTARSVTAKVGRVGWIPWLGPRQRALHRDPSAAPIDSISYNHATNGPVHRTWLDPAGHSPQQTMPWGDEGKLAPQQIAGTAIAYTMSLNPAPAAVEHRAYRRVTPDRRSSSQWATPRQARKSSRTTARSCHRAKPAEGWGG